MTVSLKRCISEPIPAIRDAARYLDAAVTAHLQGKHALAEELIRCADMPEIYRWLKLIWAVSEVHLISKPTVDNKSLSKTDRVKDRMPTNAQKMQIHERDGHHCRFCAMPVIRPDVRKRMHAAYPDTARWGTKEHEQHSAFQAMWAQYDHVVPHAMGGTNELENIVLACAACNFGRGGYTVAQVGVCDPRTAPPLRNEWDGLERFR